MKNVLVRLVSLVLCLLMLVAVLAACDEKKGSGVTTTTNNTTTTTTTGDGTTTVDYGKIGIIPEDIDYGGDYVANLLLWHNAKLQLFPEKMVDGEDIKNDLFVRNQMIEEELGVVFNTTFKESSGAGTDISFELLNEALEGTTQYDAICCFSMHPAEMAIEGILTDLYSLDYPNLSMPWYPSDIDQWSIMERQFFVTNTSSVRNILCNWVVYANNVMIEDKGLENIEEVVIAGDWTLDTLKTYSRNWASEAESNATKDEADKVYGFAVVDRNVTDALYHAAGFRTATLDEDGIPSYTFFESTSAMNAVSDFLDVVVDICDSPEFGAAWVYTAGGADRLAPLKNKNAAFFTAAMDCYYATDEDGTFSIIPLPKLDDTQENYRTTRNFAYDVWCVPSYASDVELGGMIIDATSFNDWDEISKTFFDYDFKYRYSSSERGMKIFDLIRNAYQVEFALGWGTAVQTHNYELMRWCLNKGGTTLILDNVFSIDISGKRREMNNSIKTLKTLITELYPVE